MNTAITPDPVDMLIEHVAAYFGLEPGVLKGSRRDHEAAHARGCAMWLAFNLGASCADIGTAMDRDKFLVRQTIDKVDRRMMRDGDLVSDVHTLKSSLLDWDGTETVARPSGYDRHVAAVVHAYGAFQIFRHTPQQRDALQKLLDEAYALSVAYTEFHSGEPVNG